MTGRRKPILMRSVPDAAPLVEDWRFQAACRDVDTTKILFFPADEDGRQWTAMAALRVCAGCPVVMECRGEADRTEGGGEAKVQGVWGGEGPGARLARRRAARRAKA